MKKTVKAWAVISKRGGWKFIRGAKMDVYDCFLGLPVVLGCRIVPCTITYTIPKRRKK